MEDARAEIDDIYKDAAGERDQALALLGQISVSVTGHEATITTRRKLRVEVVMRRNEPLDRFELRVRDAALTMIVYPGVRL